MKRVAIAFVLVAALVAACTRVIELGPEIDAGAVDASAFDDAGDDGGVTDAGPDDAVTIDGL